MEKLKAGILNGPAYLSNVIYNIVARARSSFCMVVKKFLGNYKAANYGELVANIHCFLYIWLYHEHQTALPRFPDCLGDVSDKHGK